MRKEKSGPKQNRKNRDSRRRESESVCEMERGQRRRLKVQIICEKGLCEEGKGEEAKKATERGSRQDRFEKLGKGEILSKIENAEFATVQNLIESACGRVAYAGHFERKMTSGEF